MVELKTCTRNYFFQLINIKRCRIEVVIMFIGGYDLKFISKILFYILVIIIF